MVKEVRYLRGRYTIFEKEIGLAFLIGSLDMAHVFEHENVRQKTFFLLGMEYKTNGINFGFGTYL